KIETAAEADSRRKLSDAEAYRIEVTGKANAAQLERDSVLIARNPLLIQKTLADKLSDKIQVIVAPPAAGGFFAGGLPGMQAMARFLRDARGSESLGIGYGALYLRAAPAGADASEVLAAIGTMASRLAWRASARRADGRDLPLPGVSPAASTVAAQIEVAESYGVHFRSVDPMLAGGRVRLCYDGDAWERVLSTPAAAPLERARAALFFAGSECLDPALPAAERRAWNDRRVHALESIAPAAAPSYPAYLGAHML